MDEHTLWAQEWRTLQADHERYEFATLGIKLVAIVSCLLGVAWAMAPALLALLLALLWLQEAVHKTFQARLGERLVVVEAALAGQAPAGAHPMQMHSDWNARRGGGAALVAEYLRHARRPTVVLPHALLLLAVIGSALID